MTGQHSDKSNPGSPASGSVFSERIGAKEKRMLKARGKSPATIWLGFSMIGLIGWSVVAPTLIGIAVGVWLDKRHPGSYSWTLMLLSGGLLIGCANASYWVAKEYKKIHKEASGKK